MTVKNEDDFVLPIFNYAKEIENFARRMQPYVQSFELLNIAIDRTLVQIRPVGRLETTIYMLGRLCMRQFEALFVLATLGHGISCNRLLRSLFEKVVDLEYLSANPDKIDDLWDFYFVELTKLDMADQAAKIDKEYQRKIERFKKPSGGFQMRW